MIYTPTIWENGKKPAINATHLNKMENELARLSNIVSVPDITETTETTMPGSYDGRLLVEEIGGVCEQDTTSGKNLLNCSGLTDRTISGITFTHIKDSDGNLLYIEANGTATAITEYGIAGVGILGGIDTTDCILNGCPSGGSYSTYSLAYLEWDASWGALVSAYDYGNGTKLSRNNNMEIANVRIIISNGYTANKLRFYPMIRKASITDATYESYTGGIPSPNPSYPQEIKKTVVSEIRTHGKNRFDKSAPWKNSYYSVSGTHTSNTDFTWFSVKTKIGDTFYQSGIVRGSDAVYVCGFKDGVFVKSFIRYTNGAIIVDADVDEIRCSVRASDAEAYMLERGSVKTAYAPYVGESVITLSQPIELYKIGDLQDVIEGNQIKRRLKAFTLGIESWKLSVSGTTYYYATSDGAIKSGSAIISSHFKRGHWNAMGKDEICMGNSQGGMLGISAQSFSSLDELKSFLSNNEVKAVYELAEEATEELPIADQIALNSLSTYDGITYLEFDSGIEPTFKGEYGTSKVGGYTLEALLTARSK